MNENNLTFEIGLYKITIEPSSNNSIQYLDKIDPIFKINISDINKDNTNSIYRTTNELLEILKSTQEFIQSFIERNLDIEVTCCDCNQKFKINIDYNPIVPSPTPYFRCNCGKLLKIFSNSKIISGVKINEN